MVSLFMHILFTAILGVTMLAKTPQEKKQEKQEVKQVQSENQK